MKLSRKTRVFATFGVVIGIGILSGLVIHAVLKPSNGSAASDLSRADELAFNNNWIGAAPLYHNAERKFLARGDAAHALYARASQIPAVMASRPLPDLISETNQLLTRPGGQDPRVHLRILVVKGMLELEYDAALAKATWQQVEQSANALGEHRLASRASGEQGILAFLLGDVAEAERRVKRAYFAAKLMMDRPAEVRYASLIGRGIVEFGRYQESLRYLDHAIDLAESHPEIAKPMIAYEAKAEALIGLKKYNEALQLIDHFIELSRPRNLRENMAEGFAVRASILEAQGKSGDAIRFYAEGVAYAQSVKHWHSLNDINASLAKAYEHVGRFEEAMQAIDAAIAANRQTPAEIYFVPRNLAIKADIAAKAGKRAEAETLYQRGSEVLEVLLRNVPTPAVERELQSEVADLYSGYFNLLADAGRLADAFQVIERAHGRIEAQSLWYDKLKPPRPETAEERTFNSLELKLLDTSDSKQRAVVLQRIYDAEQKLPSYTPGPFREPVAAGELQRQLSPDEVLLEYVLSEPSSSVLAITQGAIRRYVLPSRAIIDQYGKGYLHTIGKKHSDVKAGQALYAALMPEAPEITTARTLIIVPDGVLNVLPFAALVDKQGSYAIARKAHISVPSGTVLNLLRKRREERNSILT